MQRYLYIVFKFWSVNILRFFAPSELRRLDFLRVVFFGGVGGDGGVEFTLTSQGFLGLSFLQSDAPKLIGLRYS